MNMEKPKILLHSCCAPCSTAVIERLAPDYKITILYYNPNIYPYEEYLKRKNEELRYIDIYNKSHDEKVEFIDHDYDSERYYEAVKGLEQEREGGARCSECFRLRLTETARIAKEKGFDLFGTTLTVSPHKNSETINKIGLEVQAQVGEKYLVASFKKQDGYKRSVELAKQNNLYRQNYCGCKFALEIQSKENPESLQKKY